MTNRIFDTQPTLFSCYCNVLTCEKRKNSFAVTLDQTIFFPRGGGQPCEPGTIGSIDVLDVFEEDGEIIHLLPSPLPLGQAKCQIDGEVRLDHMQHHSGQHILSAVIERDFGISSIIARIEDNYCHLELPKRLTHQQLLQAQHSVAEIIAQNLPIACKYYTPQEASALNVRGKISPHDSVRIVEIEGFDLNGCGGSHCSTTAEVEQLLICGEKEVRGNFRIYYLCGKKALAEQDKRTSALLAMQQQLSCEWLSQLTDATSKLLVQKETLEAQYKAQKETLFILQKEALYAGAQYVNDTLFISKIYENGDIKLLKSLCDELCQGQKAVLLLLSITNGQSSLLFARSKGDGPNLGSFMKEIIAKCGGKGGGSPILAQCMCPSDVSTAFKQAVETISAQL